MKYWQNFNKNSLDFSVVECGTESYSRIKKYEYIVRRKFVLHFITEGSGFLTINNKKYRLKKNMGFIIQQDQHVQYFSDSENLLSYYWIALEGDSLDKLIQTTTLFAEDIFSFSEKNLALQTLKQFVHFNHLNPQNFQTNLQNYVYLYQFLQHLNLEFMTDQQKNIELKNKQSLANLIMEYIYENYHQNITVQDLSDHFNISRSYLYKICQKDLGSSPSEIIVRERMKNSTQLLLTTDLLIKEISEQIGYHNQFHFSKAFKQYYGYSPSEFRKLEAEVVDDLVK